MHRSFYLLFAFPPACADMMADGDGRALGDDLGRFEVSATLEQSSCGEGALGSPDEWDFDIQLWREDGELFWNTGRDAVSGRLEPDGVTFSFASETRVELEEPVAVGCVVIRTDRARGAFDDPGPEVEGFSGKLTYAFAAEEATACLGLVGVPSGFSDLPCEMTYGMRADRVSD